MCYRLEYSLPNKLDNTTYCTQSLNQEWRLPRTLVHQQVGEEAVAARHDWESSWCGKVPKESCERLDEAANLQEDQDGMLHH